MRKIFGKKGFSLVELIVVIAIIAVLLAMILPSLSSREANKKASILVARDFYSATQSLFSKYSKYEDYIYYGQKDDASKIIDYNKRLGGNYPKNHYTGIAMKVKNSKIEYVDAASGDSATLCEMNLFKKSGVSDVTNFEKMFANDITPLFYMQDGMYYAYIYFENNENKATGEENTNTVKVLAAAYCPDELPPCGTEYDEFRLKYLHLVDNGLNANEDYLGVCSSTKDTTLDKYIGEPGTYFSLYYKMIEAK